MKIVKIPIQLCHPDAKLPVYAKPGDAGMDLISMMDMDFEPFGTHRLPTGIKVAIPRGYAFEICPRSGLSAKTAFRVANAPGTIDSEFRGEMEVILSNVSLKPFSIKKGERIAQIILKEVPICEWVPVDDIHQIPGDRGGGIGSTGGFTPQI